MVNDLRNLEMKEALMDMLEILPENCQTCPIYRHTTHCSAAGQTCPYLVMHDRIYDILNTDESDE